jgi:hypothetical protein
MSRKYPPLVDHDGKPLDEATLARIFCPMDPALFDDPVCGAALRHLAVEDPDVLGAVADVDRTLIWANLAQTQEDPLAGGARQIDRLCAAMGEMETLVGFRRGA